tara:strand:- start:137 stop:760 length:624 start_codon:yes stop_codon:yes gene_type:complete
LGVRPQVFINGLTMANLITVDIYKEVEKITSNQNDFAISYYADSVSQLVKTYCNNSFVDFYSTDKIETFSINWPQYFVQLTESPVNSISGVQIRESIAENYTNLTSTQYFLDTSTDSVYRSDGASGYQNFPTGPGALRVSYRAGYAEVPTDLRLAIVDLITYYLKDEYKERQTLAGASIQNKVSTSQRNNVAFPDHIKRVLDLYKNY